MKNRGYVWIKDPLLLMIRSSVLLLFFFTLSFSSSIWSQEQNTVESSESEVVDKKVLEVELSPEQKLEQSFQKFKDLREQSLEKLKSKKDRYSLFQDQLGKAENALRKDSNLSYQQVLQYYFQLLPLWRTLSDEVVQKGFFEFKSLELENIPEVSEPLQTSKKAKSLAQFYEEYKSLQYRIYEEQRDQISMFLIRSSSARSSLLTELDRSSEFSPLDMMKENFEDIRRELSLVPYRPVAFFYQFTKNIKDQWSYGWKGKEGILLNLFRILFLISIPFFVLYFLNRFRKLLDQKRDQWITQSFQKPKRMIWVSWSQRLGPFLPWFGLWFTAHGMREWLHSTEIEFLGVFLPYVEYYSLYRIFKLLMNSLLRSTTVREEVFEWNEVFWKKTEKTSRILGRSILWIFFILYTVEATVKKGLVYFLLEDLFKYVFIFVLVMVSTLWKKEILSWSKSYFSEKTYTFIESKTNGLGSVFFTFPLFLFLLTREVTVLFLEWLESSSVGKKIYAQIYRKKLETAAKTSGNGKLEKVEPDSEYIQKFCDISWMNRKHGRFEECAGILKKWSEDKINENSISIFGDTGCGKSIFLKQIATSFPDLEVISVRIEEKLTTQKECREFFSKFLGKELLEDGPVGLIQTDEKRKKTLLLIDDAHNLFLAKEGGFHAFEEFCSYLNLQTKNLFWICTFHRYSWSYLSRAMSGSASSFRYQMKIPLWDDEETQKFILAQHQKTGYRMKFDSSIYALQRSIDEEEIDLLHQRFFNLLSTQAKGNPSVALDLWISSLHQVGKKALLVGLPEFVSQKELKNISENELFIYASLVRHQRLSTQETIQVTRFNEGAVRFAYRSGLEKEILTRNEDGRYELSSLWHGEVIQYLVQKNFVYE